MPTMFADMPLTASIKALKQAVGFKNGLGKCGTCKFFTRTPVGQLNRCALGDFPCSSKHGCNAYRKAVPLRNRWNFGPVRDRNPLQAINELR